MFIRYDDQGAPLDCMMIDFQVTRIGSPALDLNFFVFSCLEAKDIKNGSKFFNIYFDFFADALSSADFPTPFSFPELLEECETKRLFGFKIAMDSIHRFQCPLPHPVGEYSKTALKAIIDEEDKQVLRPDFNDSRLRMMYEVTFTEKLLKNSTPEEFISTLHSAA